MSGCRRGGHHPGDTVEASWSARAAEWLPTAEDDAWLRAVGGRMDEPGQMANWIAPPRRGIDDRPADFAYVRFAWSPARRDRAPARAAGTGLAPTARRAGWKSPRALL